MLAWHPYTFHSSIMIASGFFLNDYSSAWNFKSVEFLQLKKMQHNILKCAATWVNTITATTTQTEGLFLALTRLKNRLTNLDHKIAWNSKSVEFLRLQKMQHNILKCAGTRVNAITTTTTQTEGLSLALGLTRLELRTQLDLQILEEDISQRTPSLFHNIWFDKIKSHQSLSKLLFQESFLSVFQTF